MHVLFDHPLPFGLAHGGFQIQIEQTALALQKLGVNVDYCRWWESAQRVDIIHYFGRPTEIYIDLARQKGIRVVLLDLLTELGSRAKAFRLLQRSLMLTTQRMLPFPFTARLAWRAYRRADAVIANTLWEARLLREMFDAPVEKVHVIPNGVEDIFLESAPRPRGPWLVCTATIAPRKRVCELAEAAVEAQTPLWVIGKPYSDSDPYGLRFLRLTQQHSQWIRYEGPMTDRAQLATAYREARGFVLLSDRETLSLSADEAAACECPLLLSDLPWARTVFGECAAYCPITTRRARTAAVLKKFYETAPTQPRPRKPPAWLEVGRQFRAIYEQVLSTSR